MGESGADGIASRSLRLHHLKLDVKIEIPETRTRRALVDSGDDYDWLWQELKLQSTLAGVDGNAFEALFQNIAKRLWQSAFTPTIPMGSRGDLKCDGFKSDTGELFQCYGPRYGQANVDDAIAKIDVDFAGAVEHWGSLLKKWVFVVGLYQDRVPSELVRRVLQKSEEYSIPSEILTREGIVGMASRLPPQDRAALFGKAPERPDVVRGTTYANIGRALIYIRGEISAVPFDPIKLPSKVEEKIEFNFLPKAARHFLGIGQLGADQVRRYLADKVDPLEAERMVDGFKRRYLELKADGEEPARAFQQLLIFAGGTTGDIEREAAALAIVTYFFSACEIFEQPPEDSA